jgi:hypothetical protein
MADETVSGANGRRAVARCLHPARLELHEAKQVKRFGLHDRPLLRRGQTSWWRS